MTYSYDRRDFDPTRICPKCGCDEVTMEHFAATAHEGCPFYGQNYVIAQNISPIAYGTRWDGTDWPNRDEMRQAMRERMTAEEHFDRRCKRCRYAWIESMPEAVPA